MCSACKRNKTVSKAIKDAIRKCFFFLKMQMIYSQ